MKARDIEAILARMSTLPDSAKVPIPVAAVHDNVSEKSVRRHYPLVQLTDRIQGVPVSYLRRKATINNTTA
jgi:hypothetical protein